MPLVNQRLGSQELLGKCLTAEFPKLSRRYLLEPAKSHFYSGFFLFYYRKVTLGLFLLNSNLFFDFSSVCCGIGASMLLFLTCHAPQWLLFRGWRNILVTEINELFLALHKSHKDVQISEDIFNHFQDVLPPLDFGIGYFVFGEGDYGDRLLFSEIGNRFYCRSEILNVCTDDWKMFCSLKRRSDGFKVDDLYLIEGDLTKKQSKYIGLTVPSASALADSLQVVFRT